MTESHEDLGLLSRTLLTELRNQSQTDQYVFASLQRELRRIAQAKMQLERADHTLQPTALVNEAFLKIFKADLADDFWTDSARAMRLIARVMEQILNDHADAYHASKRGGPGKQRVALDESALLVDSAQSEKILAVRQAIELLRRMAPRQSDVVQLLFYGGLTQEEIAGALGVSLETVKLDWRKARAFLRVHLTASF
jgi:RNA polymerase sigma factor (TIGR02999 family)